MYSSVQTAGSVEECEPRAMCTVQSEIKNAFLALVYPCCTVARIRRACRSYACVLLLTSPRPGRNTVVTVRCTPRPRKVVKIFMAKIHLPHFAVKILTTFLRRGYKF